jgi:hypothetical protein
MIAQPLVQVLKGVSQVLGVLLRRHLVSPRGTACPGLSLGFQQALAVTHVPHVVEHHRRIALGLWGQALAWHGYGE